MPTTGEDLQPCDTCDRFTYNLKSGDHVVCTPCLDALTYVNTAPIDDLRDLIANGGGQ